MQLITDIDQIDYQKWETLLKHSPFASPFQTPDFYNFYNSLQYSAADVFAVEDAGQYLALVVVTTQKERGLKSYFSRRAIIYGGVLLLHDDDVSVAAYLLSQLRALYEHKVIYVEVRNSHSYAMLKEGIASAGFDYVPWLNYQFNNLTVDSFVQGVSKTRFRQLNKAKKNGVTWREADSLDDIRSFYTILSELYSNKVKKPLPPFDYFERLYHSSFARCLVVIKGQQIIGGVLCLIYASEALYELYICGKDKDFPNAHPSIVAMLAMVEYAGNNSISTLDLMGAGQADKSSSVRDFKSKFGGDLVEDGRFIYICKPWLYRLGRFYLTIRAKC